MALIANGPVRVLEALGRRDILLAFALEENLESVRTLMAKYADQPMSLADACLVRMAELQPRARVLTLDRHFRVYRIHGRKTVPVIMP